MPVQRLRHKRHLLRGAPASVLEEVERQGWTFTYTGSGHVRWLHPSGAFVFAASTPSDKRAWQNHLSQLRRVSRVHRSDG